MSSPASALGTGALIPAYSVEYDPEHDAARALLAKGITGNLTFLDANTGKTRKLRYTLIVTGRDGYAVALAIGELDPLYEGKSVILAYAGGEPPVSSTTLRLVVPGDVHGGRSVRDVSTIEVQ
jgi:hypothetical protein